MRSQQIGERPIQAQHPADLVVDHDEVGNGVNVFHPLLPRTLDSRKETHIFQRNGSMTRQRLQKPPFRIRNFAFRIGEAKRSQRLAVTSREPQQHDLAPPQRVSDASAQKL